MRPLCSRDDTRLPSSVERFHGSRCRTASALSAALAVTWAVLPVAAMAQNEQARKQQLFERVFGDVAKLDPATVARAKTLPPGEYLLLDSNNDGVVDEAWFIDTSARHTKDVLPILVRAIDEDGDLARDGAPDLDSDLYLADWKADGSVDAVIDYHDTDRDNDLDEMAVYYWLPHHHYFGNHVLGAWWSRDDGDDNRLWFDVNYTYSQPLCQYRCHFSGEETFVAFALKPDGNQWLAAWENPFLFYDPDGDGCSEIALRIEGSGDQVRALRYSFDADDDAYGRRTHDYDFSITAVSDPDHPVRLAADQLLTTKLRGLPTQGWLDREKARAFAAEAAWSKALLTWDEMNANTDGNVAGDPNERWEGVIAKGNADFPQIGGPSCGPLNKRNELSLKPASPLRLYFDPADRRFHLKGASRGWLHVDFDLDGKTDAEYKYTDNDGDGVFDRREIDLDADGKADFQWKMAPRDIKDASLSFAVLATWYPRELNVSLSQSQQFIDAAKSMLREYPESCRQVESFFFEKLATWMPQTHLGERMRKTPAGARLYVELVRDRLLAAAMKELGNAPEAAKIESLCASGDWSAAADLLISRVPADRTLKTDNFHGYPRRVSIRIDNKSGPQRDDWPVSIPIRQIQAATDDFDPEQCAVVAPERWLDWRQIPHQLDLIDPAIGPELSFLVDVAANSTATYHVHFGPGGPEVPTFAIKTATAQDWIPPNIGWESNRCAYRAYWGQFDFFGKKSDRLVYPSIGKANYHDETDWGIDALLVGKTSGIGGLTLYHAGKPFLVQNPAGEGDVVFTKRVLSSGPVRTAIEITATNIIPAMPELKITLTCISYAERQETQVHARVEGITGDVVVAPGFIKLNHEKTFGNPVKGYFGTWGMQSPVIGEIGMALIGPAAQFRGSEDLPAERRIKLQTAGGSELRYWIIGDWRRGRQYPVAVGAQDWHKEVSSLARMLLNDVRIGVGND